MHVGAPITIFAAADPTGTYTASAAVDLGEHAYCDLVFIATATVPASYEAQVDTSQDGTVWEPLALVIESAAGAVPLRGSTLTLQNTDGTTLSAAGAGGGRVSLRLTRNASRYLRTRVKSTGGAGTDRLAVSASLGN